MKMTHQRSVHQICEKTSSKWFQINSRLQSYFNLKNLFREVQEDLYHLNYII